MYETCVIIVYHQAICGAPLMLTEHYQRIAQVDFKLIASAEPWCGSSGIGG
jgi:hypothetical protein